MLIVEPIHIGSKDPWDLGSLPTRLVRTGVTSGLSAPISFASLLENPTIISNLYEIEVVHTTLAKATHFIMQLEQGESLAFPRVDKGLRILDLRLIGEACFPFPGHEIPSILKRARDNYGFEGKEMLRSLMTWNKNKE